MTPEQQLTHICNQHVENALAGYNIGTPVPYDTARAMLTHQFLSGCIFVPSNLVANDGALSPHQLDRLVSTVGRPFRLRIEPILKQITPPSKERSQSDPENGPSP